MFDSHIPLYYTLPFSCEGTTFKVNQPVLNKVPISSLSKKYEENIGNETKAKQEKVLPPPYSEKNKFQINLDHVQGIKMIFLFLIIAGT